MFCISFPDNTINKDVYFFEYKKAVSFLLNEGFEESEQEFYNKSTGKRSFICEIYIQDLNVYSSDVLKLK